MIISLKFLPKATWSAERTSFVFRRETMPMRSWACC